MINLLPRQEKETIIREEKWKLVLILGIVFLASLISLVLILFSIKIYTSNQIGLQRQALEIKETELNRPENRDLQKEISFFNQNLTKINSFYKTPSDFVALLERISRSLPTSAYLTSFSYSLPPSSKEEYKALVTLSGFVPTRERLFELKKNLEKEENFQEIYFPPSNWVDPINIDFSLTLKIKN